MKISIILDKPTPTGPLRKPLCEKTSLEDEITSSIALLESHRDSSIEWKALKRLYTSLCGMKQTPRIGRLRKMIQPILAKYGFHV